MQKKIVEEVEITPEEVRNFFKSIPKEDLPFWCRNGVAQIVITPKVSDVERNKSIEVKWLQKKKSKKDLVLQLKPFYILKIQGQVQMEDIINE
jgi:hypothetical protein